MTAAEDQHGEAYGSRPSAPPLRSAALAADLLAGACAPGAGDPLRLEVVRTLARDLSAELEALAVLAEDETVVVEGALRAADVANLAACAVPELLEASTPQAGAAVYLAAGAVQALSTLAEARAGDAHGQHEQNILRDVRGTVWRARLAVRQVDEFLETG